MYISISHKYCNYQCVYPIIVVVKRPLVYVVLISLLLAQTELHEFLKLPALFAHYFEHLSEQPQLSFTEFLHEHYSGHNHCDKNQGHADGLPFKDCSSCSSTIACAPVPSRPELSFEIFPAPRTQHFTHVKQFVSQSFAEIWQPPKI